MADAALANALGKRTAKTTRGRRILKKREPQIIEEAKTGLIIRGNQCANQVALLLRDLYRLRSPLATLFMRKHPEHPFEDIKKLESMCVKHDHSLFAFGSSSKKRPFRLILGRLFDGHLLDMQEFGVQDYKGISSFPRTVAESSLGSKPLVVFQGASFETDERMKRVKSLLLDWFSGPRPEKILLSGLDQVVVCSAPESTAGSASGESAASTPPVLVRRYHLQFLKSGSKLPRVELHELGPQFTLTTDRVKEPEKDRWKQSIKVPKAAKPAKVKNVSKDTMGKRSGKIHLGRQDFDQIHTVHHGKAKDKKMRAELAERKKADDSATKSAEAA